MASPKIMDVVSIRGDEYYTLRPDAEVIADHLIKEPLKLWLPFRDEESVWPDVLKNRGYDVVITSTDFFTTDPPEGVIGIVSNPPFSRKAEVLKRIKALNYKFALILPFLWLNDGVPFEYGNQLMMFRRRMYFNTPEGELNNPRTNCFVLSNGLLDADFMVIGKDGERII